MTEIPFRRACAVSDIPDHEAITVEFDDGEIAIFRDGDELFAVQGRCPHAFEEMNKAVFDHQSRTLTCLAHHYCFDLKTGKSLQPVAGVLQLKNYPIEIRDGEVFVQYEPDDGW